MTLPLLSFMTHLQSLLSAVIQCLQEWAAEAPDSVYINISYISALNHMNETQLCTFLFELSFVILVNYVR